METRAHHVLIGFFTLAAVTALLAVGLWLGKTGGDKHLYSYDVVFQEAVSGLSVGSKVEFNGIRIGEVTQLRLNPDNPEQVYARISVEDTAPIRTDTHARLVLAGVTNTSFIRLNSGHEAHSQVLQPSTAQPIPIIIASPSAISKLLNQGEDAVLNVNELLLQLKAIVSAENADSIRRTLQHVEQATAAISEQREDVKAAMKALLEASQHANTVLAQGGKLLSTTHRLLDEQGQATFTSTQQALAALENTLLTVNQLLGDNRGQIDSGLRGMSELGPTLAELRTTLGSLRAITRQLEDRPSDFLLGLQPIQEFQP